MGCLVGVSAIFGVVGALLFPLVRYHFGLLKTGLVGNICLISSLTLCVVSVWSPGSPFDLWETHSHDALDAVNVTVKEEDTDQERPLTSVILLVTGMTLARLGLWMTDLTVTQILQEGVEEEVRGKGKYVPKERYILC